MSSKGHDSSLVVIHVASNSMVAGFLKSLLEAEGIPAVVMGDFAGVWDSLAPFRPRVAVPASFVKEAREIIETCIQKAEGIGTGENLGDQQEDEPPAQK